MSNLARPLRGPADPDLPPPPISAELWARLRRFDPHCTISLIRQEPCSQEWKHARRAWFVTIHNPDGRLWDAVRVEHPRLAEALRLAVEDAERRGWAR